MMDPDVRILLSLFACGLALCIALGIVILAANPNKPDPKKE